MGVTTFRLRSGQNLNFAVPASAVMELLNNVNKPRKIAAVAPRLLSNGFAKSIGIKLVLIRAGQFMMGATKAEVDHALRENPGTKRENYDDEHPQKRVSITKPFLLASHEVTVGQFRKFVLDTGYKTEAESDGKGGFGINIETGKRGQNPKYTWKNPGFAQGESHPVVNVSWHDAAEFCQWLHQKDGLTFRLPTEAEWEYSCRAGTTTRYHSGDDPELLVGVGNVTDGTFAKTYNVKIAIKAEDGYVFTAPVSSYIPNAFGLYDMHGNVNEWCRDWYKIKLPGGTDPVVTTVTTKAAYRVYRGGSWDPRYYHTATICSSAHRSQSKPSFRYFGLGFRVAAVQ